MVTTATPRGNVQVEQINGVIKPIFTKKSIANPKMWYKHVDRLQRCINASISRATAYTPFRLMFGVDMKNAEDIQIIQVLEKEIMNNFVENRSEDRAVAAENIEKIQKENKQNFDKKRKAPQLYTVGDLVAIERMQKEKGAKFHTAMVGPYEVVNIKRNNRYDVQKIGFGDGPMKTSTDRMKPWIENKEE